MKEVRRCAAPETWKLRKVSRSWSWLAEARPPPSGEFSSNRGVVPWLPALGPWECSGSFKQHLICCHLMPLCMGPFKPTSDHNNAAEASYQWRRKGR